MTQTLMDPPTLLPESIAVPRKRWTRTEYRQLMQTGFLEDGKYELVLGEIWKKMGQGRLHIIVVMRIIKALEMVFGFARLQSQSSLPVGEDGEPEPDLAVLAQNLDHYREMAPTPAEVLLVVEASDSTLRPDLTAKARQYASAGISDYWVVNIQARTVHVFRQPTETGYGSEMVFADHEEVRPLAAPDAAVRVADLLP